MRHAVSNTIGLLGVWNHNTGNLLRPYIATPSSSLGQGLQRNSPEAAGIFKAPISIPGKRRTSCAWASFLDYLPAGPARMRGLPAMLTAYTSFGADFVEAARRQTKLKRYVGMNLKELEEKWLLSLERSVRSILACEARNLCGDSMSQMRDVQAGQGP